MSLRLLLWRYAPHLLVAVTAAAIFFVATDLFPYHSANHDEGVYLQQAAMLMDGQLTLHPPVEDAFRPWFFVESGDTLYPKYAPVPAALFAIGLAIGAPRITLAVIAAVIAGLTYGIGRELFDRTTGLLAGALLLTSPLFVLDTATFLPYAPTTALNLVFAYAYLRAERPSPATDSNRTQSADSSGFRWAVLAGTAIGLAFFARPYTAVLFATPFIAHAIWTLVHDGTLTELTPLRTRRAVTALTGLLGVVLALAYNWILTGDPLLFPFEAFARLDGLGFGMREILDHSVEYTPELALEVNAQVLRVYLSQWAPLGLLGSILAGIGALLARQHADWRHATLGGIFVTVSLGNIYFWGNYNILGAIGVPGDGLISILGPYYHFDLLLPTAVFAAHGLTSGARWVAEATTTRLDPRQAAPVLSIILIGLLVVAGGATTAAFSDPIDRNAGVTTEYERAYAPFSDDDGPPENAVVFLPEPYGPWLNHPFQSVRNDPRFDGETIYALHENEFAVVDAYPDRDYYRYAYRGIWNPFDGSHVTPTLQPVSTVSGDTVTSTISVELPTTATSTSLRLETPDGQAYYAAPASGGSREFSLHVNDTQAWVSGQNVASSGKGTGWVAVSESADIVLEINVNRPGGGFSYRVVLPVTLVDGERRAMTPKLEVCTAPQLCGGEAAYIPGPGGSRFGINATIGATAGSE